jgi:hypothetical protein
MRARQRGLLRLVALLVLCAGIAVLVVALSSGGHSDSPPAGSRTAQARPRARAQPTKLLARVSPVRLPAPISGEAAVAGGGGVLSIGGVDSSDVSSATIVRIPPTGKPVAYGSLVEPLHDAAAAAVGGQTLVFGGGAASEFDSVEALRPKGHGEIVGRLPSARSDVAATTIGRRAFLIGGFDGATALADVLETADGRSFRRIASLREGVRYAAAAAFGRTIYVFGGELATGADSDAIEAVEPATGRTRIVGHLPAATSHASAVALDGRIYVLGGRSAGVASDRVIAFDPATGEARSVGRLPYAVQNAAAATDDGTAYLVGGLGADGSALNSIATVRLVPR